VKKRDVLQWYQRIVEILDHPPMFDYDEGTQRILSEATEALRLDGRTRELASRFMSDYRNLTTPRDLRGFVGASIMLAFRTQGEPLNDSLVASRLGLERGSLSSTYRIMFRRLRLSSNRQTSSKKTKTSIGEGKQNVRTRISLRHLYQAMRRSKSPTDLEERVSEIAESIVKNDSTKRLSDGYLLASAVYETLRRKDLRITPERANMMVDNLINVVETSIRRRNREIRTLTCDKEIFEETKYRLEKNLPQIIADLQPSCHAT